MRKDALLELIKFSFRGDARQASAQEGHEPNPALVRAAEREPEVYRCNFWWEKSVLLFHPFHRIRSHYFKEFETLAEGVNKMLDPIEFQACRKRSEICFSVFG